MFPLKESAFPVALLCPGLGRVYRGYERFAGELFQALPKTTSLVLFKGGGPRREREVVVGSWRREGGIAGALECVWKDRSFWEAVLFGVLAWPKVLRAGFRLVHYSEPPLNALFSRLERWSVRPPRRLFSHALNMGPEHCLRCHHLHQTSPVAYEAALTLGVPEDRMTLLPYGLDTSQFQPAAPALRLELRRRYRIPPDVPVVLCVAALNREHKRVDRLVHAMAELKEDCHLLLCGRIEDQTIIDEARMLLGRRLTHLYVAPDAMVNVYAVADLFVLPSLVEGFGLAVLEAALSGLPVLVHDSPHFRWMLGSHWDTFTNMIDGEELRDALRWRLGQLPKLAVRTRSLRSELVDRFDWSNLIPHYLEMYRRAMQTPPSAIATIMGRS